MTDKEFKRLSHSWGAVLLPQNTHISLEGRDSH